MYFCAKVLKIHVLPEEKKEMTVILKPKGWKFCTGLTAGYNNQGTRGCCF